MTKLDYSRYITNLKFDQDDLLIMLFGTEEEQVRQRKFGFFKTISSCRFYYLRCIEEMHAQVNYNPSGEPRCLFIKPIMPPKTGGQSVGWWATPGNYYRVDKALVSDEVSALYDQAYYQNHPELKP